MVFAVGLTGNIASGKSTAAKFFASLGIEVINADEVSRSLTEKDAAAYQAIVSHFGAKVLSENGLLNRAVLREIIFNDTKERIWLEQLLHPLIRLELEQQVRNCKTAYCVVEIPLLYNKEHYPYLNKILVITTTLQHQISRVMTRDHCSEGQAWAIINTQPPTSKLIEIANDVVSNDSGLEAFEQALLVVHEKYMREILTY